jgi:hypothetical protein
VQVQARGLQDLCRPLARATTLIRLQLPTKRPHHSSSSNQSHTVSYLAGGTGGEGSSGLAESSRHPFTQPSAAADYQNVSSAPVPVFEFINTTGPEQYSEADARTRARAHVMRQVHAEKDKERALRALREAGGGQIESENVEELIKLANLGLSWTGPIRGNLRPRPPNPMGMDSALAGPSRLPETFRRVEIESSSEPQALQDPPEESDSVPGVNVPIRLPHLEGMGVGLGGLEQRLVVPRTISPGAFAVDLAAVENIRHCELRCSLIDIIVPAFPPYSSAYSRIFLYDLLVSDKIFLPHSPLWCIS